MSKYVQAQSLPIKLRQTIELPVFTKFLSAVLDHRFNNCQLWYLCEKDDDKSVKREQVEIVMLRALDELTPISANYVGQLRDGAGWISVFAQRETEKLPITLP